jgi:hypothetical protein
MAGERSRYGLVVSALGAIVLAVSVFLPWYGVSFTAGGLAFVQQVGNQVASQFGNAALQGYVSGLHANLSGLAGRELTALSAHQALKDLNIVLLVLAALALLDALVPLARHAGGVPEGAGASVVVLGSIAVVCVAYRMVVPPKPAGDLISLSLREGAWLALLGSLTMVGGGLWPRLSSIAKSPGSSSAKAWSGLSGWTPEG